LILAHTEKAGEEKKKRTKNKEEAAAPFLR
jgi:hypothetical protein